MTHGVRRLVVTLVAALVAAISTSAGYGGTATCGARTVAQPFLPWLDTGHYFLVPGGGFEDGTDGWTLGGGAAVVDGNEDFHVGGASDRHSLSLPPGAWAQTPMLCVDGDEPTMRFFARNNGSVLSLLAVEARIRTRLLGLTLETTLPLGLVPGLATSWQPSLPVIFKLSPNQLVGGASTVSFRFVPLLANGSWQIDDVYVDPFKDR